MNRKKYLASAALLLAIAAPGVAAAQTPPGDVIVDMRLRYENVDQDGFGKDAQALTLRTRLGYETPAWNGFKALIEGESVIALVDDYNDTVNGKTQYPIVADPEDTELNRLQISWTGKQGEAVVGRQRIILNNARHVGNVGFRQNEQTFDAARLAFKPTKDVTFSYVYLDRVHRIFGDDSPQGEWDSDSHLMQVDAKLPAGHALSAYGYLLEFENAAPQSSSTWGARFTGSRPLGNGLAATYEAEYARQTDYKNNALDFELDYVALGAGVKKAANFATINFERLEGDGVRGFQTPLATLHAFQGWADVFLNTPTAGVRDLNVKAGTTMKLGPNGLPVKLQAAVHDFAEDDGSDRYGREVDLLASAPINKMLAAEVKAAFFDGDRPGFADRTKIWFTLEFKY